MPASPAQVAANRANALLSSGPKTVAGKEASRRNSLKHGLTGRGIVVPGEDVDEIGNRVTVLEAALVPEGDVVAALLVRQLAIATVRIERAYRHETALIAERTRLAADAYTDERYAVVESNLQDLETDAPTARRRLLMIPEGVDALLARLHALREKANPRYPGHWISPDGDDLDRCLGRKSGRGPLSRVGQLTRGIGQDLWEPLDPAEYEHLTEPARKKWAVGELRQIIEAEIKRLEAHKTTLDPERAIKGRAEAPERSLLHLGSEGQMIRRYAGAAERSMKTMLAELRTLRREAETKATATPAPASKAEVVVERPLAPEVAAVLNQVPAQMAEPYLVPDELGSILLPPLLYRRVGLASILTRGKTSFVPVTIGREPRRSRPTGP